MPGLAYAALAMRANLRLTIDTTALAANWRAYARASGAATCGAAVKADGYGLGGREVAAAIVAAGCRELFVAHWVEAAALGPQPPGVRVAVLHGVLPDELATALASPAVPVLNTAAQVAAWRAATNRPCDVMIDTGINRLGLTPAEALSGLLDRLSIDVLHSHLACAEAADHAMNLTQLHAFQAVAAAFPKARLALCNSAGIGLGQAFHCDLTRPGLGLYGGGDRDMVPQQAVVALAARVVQLRDVAAGETIGYGATVAAATAMRIAVVALGYADGLPRLWPADRSDPPLGAVGRPLGRVSMDLSAFDVSHLAGIAEGDWLDIGFDLHETAAMTGRSPYELLTGLGRRYERVYR